MKITQVDVYLLKCQNLSDPDGWRPIGCRILTDEGIYGDGEAALAWGKASDAVIHMIKDYAEAIIGMDPLDHEVIWDKLYRNYYWGQNGGPIVFGAISAIDIALWDIKGKYFNVPVYKLLGGKKRDKLRTYASQLQQGWGENFSKSATIDDYVELSKLAVSEGYDCLKIDFFTYDEDGRRFNHALENTQILSPYHLNLVERRVAAVREAVGPGVDIIVENHAYTDTNSSVQIGRALEKYNIFYFEEPNTAFLPTVKYVGEKVNIPIAHGERLYSRWQFAPYFEKSAIQVIQPDLGTCGGITEGKKICDMAYTYDVSVQIHICGSPLLTAASLQLECTLPHFQIHEHHNINCRKYNIDLCKYDYQPVNGYIGIPEIPGIGNEFTEETLKISDRITVR